MPTIYEYHPLTGYYTGNQRTITDKDGAPDNWTRAPLPNIHEGSFAYCRGSVWFVTDLPAPHVTQAEFFVPPTPPAPAPAPAPTVPQRGPTVVAT